MQTRLIAVGVGALGYGVLAGWAFTADYWEQKHLVAQRLLRKAMSEQNVSHYNNIVFAPAATEEELTPYEVYQRTKNLIAAQDEVDLTPIRGDEPAEVSFVQREEDKLDETSLDDEEPGVWTEATAEITTEVEVPDATEDDIPFGETEEETKANLQRLIDAYTMNGEDAHDFVEHAMHQLRDHAADTAPFVISRETYMYDPEEGDSYAKITLMYYVNQRVLLDDDQDVIDIEDYIGWKSLSAFGGDSLDEDVVFVRNRRLSTDYEVIRDSETNPPAHVRYGMTKTQFEVERSAGNIHLRDEDG